MRTRPASARWSARCSAHTPAGKTSALRAIFPPADDRIASVNYCNVVLGLDPIDWLILDGIEHVGTLVGRTKKERSSDSQRRVRSWLPPRNRFGARDQPGPQGFKCFAPRESWIPVALPAPVRSGPNFLRHFRDREKAQLPQAFARQAWEFESRNERPNLSPIGDFSPKLGAWPIYSTSFSGSHFSALVSFVNRKVGIPFACCSLDREPPIR